MTEVPRVLALSSKPVAGFEILESWSPADRMVLSLSACRCPRCGIIQSYHRVGCNCRELYGRTWDQYPPSEGLRDLDLGTRRDRPTIPGPEGFDP